MTSNRLPVLLRLVATARIRVDSVRPRRSSQSWERVFEGSEYVNSAGRLKLVDREVATRYSDRNSSGRFRGVNVTGRVTDDEDVGWAQLTMQSRRLFDRYPRQLSPIR